MTDESHDELDRLLDAGSARSQTSNSQAERSREWRALLNVADLLWEGAHGAPPLEDDPVAAMLGLLADPQAPLDAKSLARLRKRSGLKVADLARRLRARGWQVESSDIFRWETRSAADVPPALIRAAADELDCPYDALISKHPLSLPSAVAGVLASSRYRELVERWSRLSRTPLTAAESALRSRMLSTVHRGAAPSEEQILQSLEALVGELEEASDERS